MQFDPNGDLLVADPVGKAVYRVDLGSGDRTIVSSADVGAGPAFTNPFDLALEADGQIVVSDKDGGSVIRVDPGSGDRTVVASETVGAGIPPFRPFGIAVLPDGGILLAVPQYLAILRVDPKTGDRTIFSSKNVGSGEPFLVPRRVAVVPPRVEPGDAAGGDPRARARAGGRGPVAGAAVLLGLGFAAILVFRFFRRGDPS